MSIRVIEAVLSSSESTATDRVVAIVLAETAHHDGVGWLLEDTIAERAKCSTREVRRALKALEELGELERRKAQRGRRRIGVFRVVVSPIGTTSVDYERLPFELDRPFDDRTDRPAVSDRRPDEPSADDRTDRPPHIKEEPSDEPSSSRTRRARPRDLVYDVVVELCGSVLKGDEKRRGSIVRDLKAALEGLEPEAMVDEIRRRARAYRQEWPNASLTDTALRKHFGRYEERDRAATRPSTCPECGTGGGLHVADCPLATKGEPE